MTYKVKMILLASVVLILVAILIFISSNKTNTGEEITEEGFSAFPLGGSRNIQTETNQPENPDAPPTNTGETQQINPPSLPFFSQSVISSSELPKKKDYTYVTPSSFLLTTDNKSYLGYIEGSGISEQAYFNMRFPKPFRDYLSKIQDEYVAMGVLNENEKLTFQNEEEIMLFIMATLDKYPEYLLDYGTLMPETSSSSTEMEYATTTEE